MFPGELETQLGGMRDVQGQLAQGMQQLASDVDTKLVQNDRRDNSQEGRNDQGYMYIIAKFRGEIGQNHHENMAMYQKVTKVEQQMEGIGNVIEGGSKQKF